MLSETAILHLQNGFILPSFPPFSRQDVFQNAFRKTFPLSVHCLRQYYVRHRSLYTYGTLVVPGSHQRIEKPDQPRAQCRSRSMRDSTLWHAAGQKHLRHENPAISLRARFSSSRSTTIRMGDAVVLEQPARTQQLLGWYSQWLPDDPPAAGQAVVSEGGKASFAEFGCTC